MPILSLIMSKKMKESLIVVFLSFMTFVNAQDAPNILWIVCEDQSMFFAPYGDSSAFTPNINALSNDGVVYHNCYTPSPVCAPSRSSLITGMYPTTLGTQHMRAYKKTAKNKDNNPHNQLPYYSPKPSKVARFFTEDLRANGYYCSNNAKEDYNMECSPLAWDESNKDAHWRNRKGVQPFFSVFNFMVTHESNIWNNEIEYSQEEINPINVPPIFPNHPSIKRDVATNYKNIEILDQKIGQLIAQLKEDGLYDKTIIFFMSDHGGPFPRYKRSIYETGIRVPMIVKWIDTSPQKRNIQLISFVDFAPTVLEAAQVNSDINFEGVSFFKKDQRSYVYAATDRFDGHEDQRRSIRGRNFKLIYNADTSSSMGKAIAYRKQMKTMQVLDSLKDKNELNASFSHWYAQHKDRFELYEVSEDYYETNNLISNPKYNRFYLNLKDRLFAWMTSSDFGNISESEMLQFMFSDSMTIAKIPEIECIHTASGCFLESNMEGVSIGWRNKGAVVWNVYQKETMIDPKNHFEVLAFKMGYKTLIKAYVKEE